jgi:hypothetical protein
MVPLRRFFHYTHSIDAARSIARTRVLIPHETRMPSGIGAPCGYCEPRVNLTTAPPERGTHAILTATGLSVEPAFGLELLVDTEQHTLRQLFPEQFPSSYQIFTDEPVPVKVTRMYNVERAYKMAQRGRTFVRFGPELSFLSYAT